VTSNARPERGSIFIEGREEMIDDSDLQDVEDAIVLEEARRGG
jgi:hypothetical protein